jgi:CHAD domain-containing protein
MRGYALLQTAALLRRFAYQVNRAERQNDADSIHDLRVSIRRLSRCLRVFSQFYPADARRKIRRKLAALMRLAAGIRDRDIALHLLAEAGISPRGVIGAQLWTERSAAAQELAHEIRRWKSRGFFGKWRARLEL